MAAESDVPPLEDMSDLLQKAEKYQKIKEKAKNKAQSGRPAPHINGNNTAGDSKNSVNVSSPSAVEASGVASNSNSGVSKQTSKSSSDFGGLKKGFMFGGSKPASRSSPCEKKPVSTSVKKESKCQTLEEIPFIKKQEKDEADRFKFSEVQEAMQNSTSKLMENRDQWVTDDLLSKLENNKKMVQRLQDPRFMQALSEFQSNPQQVFLKYQNNQEVQEFLQEFCGLMGEHFTKLADKQGSPSSNQTSSTVSSGPAVQTRKPGGADLTVQSSTNPNQPTHADELKMQEILSNPEIQTVLMDPRIQSLFDTLRRDPDEGQKLLRTADADMREKIQKLVSAGLLQFQR